jgi:phage-related minor tail protein
MINLGDAILYFKGDMSGLKAVGDDVLGITTSIQKAALNVGVGMTAMGAAGAVAFIPFVTEAMDAEQQVVQLEARIKSTGGVAGVTAAAAIEMANGFQKSTGVEADMVMQGQNMLLTFTKIGADVFPDATQAVLDMATAMNGGAIPSGEQLSHTAIQVGKALNDPVEGVNALRRVGVMLKDEQKEQIQSFLAVNDIASAQGIILKELATEFGGAAEAARNTLGGALANIWNNSKDLREEIGKALIPALTTLANTVGTGLEMVVDFAKEHETLTKVVALTAAGLTALVLTVGPIIIVAATLALTIGKISTAYMVWSLANTAMATVGLPSLGTAIMAIARTALPTLFAAVTRLATVAMPMLTSEIATLAGPLAIGFCIVSIGLLIKALYDWWDAERQLTQTNEEMAGGLKQLADALDRNNIAYDKAKLATMSVGDGIDYLHGLYMQHRQDMAENAEKLQELPPLAQEIVDKLADVGKDFADKMADYKQEMLDDQDDARQKLQNMNDDFASKLQDAGETLASSLVQTRRKLSEELSDINSEWRKKQADLFYSSQQLQQDYLDGVRDRGQDYQDNITDTTREANHKLANLNKELKEADTAEEKERIQKQIDELRASTEEKLIIAQREYQQAEARAARELEQAKERLARQAALEEQAYQEKIAKANQRAAQEEQRANEAAERATAKMREQFERQVRDFEQAEERKDRDREQMLAKMERDNAAALNAIKEEYGLTDAQIVQGQKQAGVEVSAAFAETANNVSDSSLNMAQQIVKNAEDAAKAQTDTFQESASDISTSEAYAASWIGQSWLGMVTSFISNLSPVNQAIGGVIMNIQMWFSDLWGRVASWFGFAGGGVVGPGGAPMAGGGVVGYATGGLVQAMATGGTSRMATILAGEEGPELAVAPSGMAAILGARGPGLYNLPVGTEITPARETSGLRLSNVPRFAAGGTVSAGGGGITQHNTFNFPGITIREEADIRKISREIGRECRLQLSGAF